MTQTSNNLIERYFDTAFTAPNGIAKLRELILSLAMQGKLVEQDPKDPPASELLKEIEAEKQRLVAEKKIKKQQSIPPIKPEEMPYELPKGWSFVRNSLLFSLKKGKVPRDLSDKYGVIPYLDIEALDRGNVRRYTNDKNAPQSSDKDILVVCDGSRSGLVLDGQNGVIGSTLSIIETLLIIQPFVKLIFRQSYQRLNTTMKGSAIPHLDTKNLLLSITGLPPLPEQHRIVARIEQLMARCDELEKLRKAREESRLAVHAAAIKQLLDVPQDNAWTFIQQHFTELYTVKENVTELRKAILQLAMMGRLVPQDPKDPPASELLKKIETEKQRLEAEKKIKKQKPLPPIKLEEIPYELPKGWEWVRLGEIGVWKSGTTPSRSNLNFYNGDIAWVKSGEIKQGRIKITEETITQAALKECSLSINHIGSVLVAMYGANIGEVGILEINAATNQAVCACETYTNFDERYLLYLITSLKSYFLSQGAGAAQPNISREKIVATICPLPPLPEQHRIVARIDKLMALCDQLDQQIDMATDKQSELLNALMARV